MKKLLVISGRGFPPELDTGVFRTLRMVKYLSQFGYSSIVLAPKMNIFTEIDRSLLREVPRDTKVVRSINPLFMLEHYSLQKLMKSFMVFDSDLGWLPFGYSKARKIIEEERVDAILSSSPPVVSHIIASLLKKRKDIPWLADFRDAWTGHQDYWAPTESHKHLEESIEREVMSVADRVVFASDGELEDFKRKHKSISPERLLFLPTGFDEDDFKGLNPGESGKLIISHIGTLDHHYPLDFFRALQEMSLEMPEFENSVRVVVCGKIHPSKMKELRAIGLGGMIEIKGVLPHKDALQQLISSDVLLLFYPDNERYRRVYKLKLFEYLAGRRFVLAVVPSGSGAVNFIEETQCGTFVSPDDYEGMKSELRRLFQEYRKNGRIECHTREEALVKYNTRSSAQILATQLDALTGGRR